MENENKQEELTALPNWEETTRVKQIKLTTGNAVNPTELILEDKTISDIKKIVRLFN